VGPAVVLAIALAAAALGAVIVAGRLLWRQVRRARADLAAIAGRVTPLVQELTEELAVTSTEAEAVRTALSRRDATPIRAVPRAEPSRTPAESLY